MTTAIAPADAAQAGCLPRKSFDAEFKALDDSGEFSLYALAFGNVDRQGDIIESGAVDNINELSSDGWGTINHRGMDLPIAYVSRASQDSRGLLIDGRFHSTPEAQACRTVVKERMQAGKRVLCSIGYLSRDESFERVDGQMIRRIKRLSVYEFSFVNLPANNRAEVTLVKSMDTDTKSGRVISRANYTRLRDLADQLTQHAATITEFLKPHDPDASPPGDDGKSDDGAESRRVELRRRAVAGRRIRSCP